MNDICHNPCEIIGDRKFVPVLQNGKYWKNLEII